MRILVFSPIDIRLSLGTAHNGGGWIHSFLKEMQQIPSIELAVAFIGNNNDESNDDISLFPITQQQGLIYRVIRYFSCSYAEKTILSSSVYAINCFKPDLIHIFGSENIFGKIIFHTSIPCVIHLQGFLPSYENAKYPPGFSKHDFLPNCWLHPFQWIVKKHLANLFSYHAQREKEIVCHCKRFLGRTEWDRAIVDIYAPKAQYWYCSEFLREPFYNAMNAWKRTEHSVIKIVSVISTPVYKGHDLILKTAKQLIENTDLKFEWHGFGVCEMKLFARKLGISPSLNRVIVRGTVPAEILVQELLSSDIYVHPSYIDNSPNSLCEAQMLGVPCIAVNAGGVSSLIKNNVTGFLVPANDPVMMASKILCLVNDKELALRFSKYGSRSAQIRHDKKRIVANILECYRAMLTH